MITKQQYVEYLISTPINYPCTNLAEHLDGVSHDVATDYQISAPETDGKTKNDHFREMFARARRQRNRSAQDPL